MPRVQGADRYHASGVCQGELRVPPQGRPHTVAGWPLLTGNPVHLQAGNGPGDWMRLILGPRSSVEG